MKNRTGLMGNVDKAREYHTRARECALGEHDEGGESLACGQLGLDEASCFDDWPINNDIYH